MSYSPSSSIPSSPASSPSLGPIDSSPPSSPATRSIGLDSPPESPLVHPFAGNSKAIKRFRLYEKREQRWGAEITDELLLEEGDGETNTSFDLDASMTACGQSESEGDDIFAEEDAESTVLEEHEVWEQNISDAIDQGNGLIDLSSTSYRGGGGLTTIPPSIADLEKLVVLPGLGTQPTRLSPAPSSVTSSPTKPSSSTRRLMRAATAPALVLGRNSGDGLFLSNRLAPTSRKAFSSSQAMRTASASTPNAVQLYIANHSITALPTELFWVGNLTVLSLRGNALTSIPPQIASSFLHLRDLNVSLNNLTYLPAEILNLRLESVAVTGNPWLSPPDTTPSRELEEMPLLPKRGGENVTYFFEPGGDAEVAIADAPLLKKPICTGEKIHRFTVPPFTELCFRVLMAPSIPTLHVICSATREHIPAQKRETTVLESKYEVPLVRSDFPAHIIDTIYGCIPRSITDKPKDERISKIHASPSKKARLDYTSASFRDPFALPSLLPPAKLLSPFPLSPVPSSNYRPRTPSHTHSRSSLFPHTDRPPSVHHAPEPSKPTHPGISVCPSPFHLHQQGKPVYVRHAVERYTWEDEIAGVKMGEAGGVPVLWRGCGARCLDWLDEDEDRGEEKNVKDGEDGIEVGDGGLQDAEEGDDELQILQPVDLRGGLLDEFDDDG